MTRAYFQMISAVPQIFTNGTNVDRPKIIITIDEAHPLSEMQEIGFQPAYLLCRAISLYSRYTDLTASIWVVFASTTLKVADFAAPEAVRACSPKISLSFFTFSCSTRSLLEGFHGWRITLSTLHGTRVGSKCTFLRVSLC